MKKILLDKRAKVKLIVIGWFMILISVLIVTLAFIILGIEIFSNYDRFVAFVMPVMYILFFLMNKYLIKYE